MTALSRRHLLACVAALSATAGGAFAADDADGGALAGIHPAGAAEIGRAWLAANPGLDARRLERELFPQGAGPAALSRLRARVADDFRRRRMFAWNGWRLSDTEARVFALLALRQPRVAAAPAEAR